MSGLSERSLIGYVGETVHNVPGPFWADVVMFSVDVALARA